MSTTKIGRERGRGERREEREGERRWRRGREEMERRKRYQKSVMLLWVAAQILVNASRPILLHVIPVVNDSVSDRIIYVVVITLNCGLCSDEKVQVGDIVLLSASLGVSDRGDQSGDDVVWLRVARIAHLCVTSKDQTTNTTAKASPGSIVDHNRGFVGGHGRHKSIFWAKISREIGAFFRHLP